MAEYNVSPGKLPQGANGEAIQVSTNIQEDDGDTIISPVAVTSAANVEVKIPADAIALIIEVADADLKFGSNSDLDGTALGKGFKTGRVGAIYSLPVAKKESYFFKALAGDSTLEFYFEMLQG